MRVISTLTRSMLMISSSPHVIPSQKSETGCNLLNASTAFSFFDGIMKLKAVQRWLSWGFAKLCFLIFPICTKIKLAWRRILRISAFAYGGCYSGWQLLLV